jgi:ABC-type transport system involved in multi-copper enzyme maturation permease subunit
MSENAKPEAQNLDKKSPILKGLDIFTNLPGAASTIMKNASTSSLLSAIFFIVFAILFGLIFFYTNINVNGPTRPTMFVGYCVWAWIALLCLVILEKMALKFFSFFMKKRG